MQGNGAGLNAILQNLSQNRIGTIEVPARSSNSPPPGAIAIGGSSSNSVAAQLVGETARPRRKEERSASRSPRNRKPAIPAPDIPAPPPIALPPPPPPAPTIGPKKTKASVQIGSTKRRHSVSPDCPEESMPDHEPSTPPPPLPPPSEPPAATSIVARVAQHMAQAKAKREKYLTPDEALDRLLAEHDKKKTKAAKKAVGRGRVAIRDQ